MICQIKIWSRAFLCHIFAKPVPNFSFAWPLTIQAGAGFLDYLPGFTEFLPVLPRTSSVEGT